MKAMVLCSGGVDSTTCLGMAVDKYGAENVIALSIYYGQKHTKEIECAKKVTQHYQVEHLSLDLEKIFQYSDCSLLSHSDKEIPQESYASQIEKTNGTPVSTYVPVSIHPMLKLIQRISCIPYNTLYQIPQYLSTFLKFLPATAPFAKKI